MPNRGFSLIEAMLSAALLAMFATSTLGILAYGNERQARVGKKIQAIFLAEEGLEAVRALRNQNYTLVTPGTFGLATANGQWALQGQSDTTGWFTRQLSINDTGSHSKTVSSSVSWLQGDATMRVELLTRFTDWTFVSSSPVCSTL